MYPVTLNGNTYNRSDIVKPRAEQTVEDMLYDAFMEGSGAFLEADGSFTVTSSGASLSLTGLTGEVHEGLKVMVSCSQIGCGFVGEVVTVGPGAGECAVEGVPYGAPSSGYSHFKVYALADGAIEKQEKQTAQVPTEYPISDLRETLLAPVGAGALFLEDFQNWERSLESDYYGQPGGLPNQDTESDIDPLVVRGKMSSTPAGTSRVETLFAGSSVLLAPGRSGVVKITTGSPAKKTMIVGKNHPGYYYAESKRLPFISSAFSLQSGQGPLFVGVLTRGADPYGFGVEASIVSEGLWDIQLVRYNGPSPKTYINHRGPTPVPPGASWLSFTLSGTSLWVYNPNSAVFINAWWDTSEKLDDALYGVLQARDLYDPDRPAAYVPTVMQESTGSPVVSLMDYYAATVLSLDRSF